MVRTPALGFRERVYCSVEYKVLGAFLDQLRVAELLHPSLAFGGSGVNLFPASRSTRDQQAEAPLPVRPRSIHTCRSQRAPLSSECRSGRQTEAAAFVADELAVCLEPDSLRPVEYPCGPLPPRSLGSSSEARCSLWRRHWFSQDWSLHRCRFSSPARHSRLSYHSGSQDMVVPSWAKAPRH